MGTASSSPYEIGAEVQTSLKSKGWHWTLFAGKRRGEQGPNLGPKAEVSIFKANLKELGPDRGKYVKHALAKLKTLRHPHVLEFIDASIEESTGEAMLVSELITPLPDWLDQIRQDPSVSSQLCEALITFGLRCLLEALNFLHSSNLNHGFVCPEAIFVTR